MLILAKIFFFFLSIFFSISFIVNAIAISYDDTDEIYIKDVLLVCGMWTIFYFLHLI